MVSCTLFESVRDVVVGFGGEELGVFGSTCSALLACLGGFVMLLLFEEVVDETVEAGVVVGELLEVVEELSVVYHNGLIFN